MSYPTSFDEDLLSWIVTINDLHLPVSVLALQKKVKLLILSDDPSFKASKSWIRKVKERIDLSRCRRTSLFRRLPSQLKSTILSIYSKCAKLFKIGKYPFPLIGNMDEIPVFFDMVPKRSLILTIKRSITIRISGSEKRHVTSFLRLLLMDLFYYQ